MEKKTNRFLLQNETTICQQAQHNAKRFRKFSLLQRKRNVGVDFPIALWLSSISILDFMFHFYASRKSIVSGPSKGKLLRTRLSYALELDIIYDFLRFRMGRSVAKRCFLRLDLIQEKKTRQRARNCLSKHKKCRMKMSEKS